MKIINKSIEVDISQVQEWKDNPRGIKDEDMGRLKKQLQKFGQYKSLICIKENEVYVVIGGNMRFRAMTDQGCSHGCVYCFTRKKLKISKVKQFETDKSLEKFIAGERNIETRWCDFPITLHWGGMSDPFQPIEREVKNPIQ